MKYNDFDVIHTFVTLARSGDHKSKSSLLRAVCKAYPGLKGEEVMVICKDAIKALARSA